MDAYSEGSGGRRQKPCRACTDFKSWMRTGPNQSKETENNSNDNKAQTHINDQKHHSQQGRIKCESSQI